MSAGRWQIVLFALLLPIVSSPSADAGQFFMEDVAAVIVESNYGYMAIEVRGSARYIGTLDAGDQSYQINTLLNNNRDGDSLSNWSAPDDEGGGLTGSGITEGMIIHCNGPPCAAYGNLYRENCPTTYNYRGRGAVVVYHQFNPEIDTEDTFTYLVDCATPPYDGGGGGGGGGGVDPCGSSASTVSTTSSIGPGELLANEPGSYPLERRDRQGEMRYLLEEWAVFSVSPGPGRTVAVDPVNGSSPRFARAAAAQVRAGRPPASADVVLVVEGVDHPRNERHVPTPEVRLRGEPLVADAQGHDLVLRADFAKTGELVDLQVIYADGPVSDSLLTDVRERLELVYADSRRHRAIAFVTLDLEGSVTLRSGRVVLPLCCCYTDEGGGIYCV